MNNEELGNNSADLGKSKTNVGRHRWTILALIFFATTINYLDRQVLGILAPVLEKEIGWSELEYGYIVVAFQLAYAIGLLGLGRLIDRLGSKIGYAVAIMGWSIAAMAHAGASSVIGFATARFGLGVSEAGNFPAAVKAVAEWFPKKERAFAIGLFNSGSNVGAIIAPLMVPWLTITYGWQEAFIVTGALGFVFVVLWLIFYDRPEKIKKLKPTELAYIQSDPPDPEVKIPWLTLIKHKEAWAFAVAKFLTDPIWWFYLYWIPKFLFKEYSLSLSEIGLPLIIIYVMADVGSIGGGWLSSFFINKGWSVDKGRKTAMLIMAICVIPIVFASQASEMWMAVVLLSLATAAHQGWSANLFATVSDTFPKAAVASVVGFGGMAGAVGGMLIATIAGFLLEFTGSYVILFVICGSAYLIAWFILKLLVPKLETIELKI